MDLDVKFDPSIDLTCCLIYNEWLCSVSLVFPIRKYNGNARFNLCGQLKLIFGALQICIRFRLLQGKGTRGRHKDIEKQIQMIQ